MLNLPFGMLTKDAGQRGQLRNIFKAVEEPLWNAREPHLGADKCSHAGRFWHATNRALTIEPNQDFHIMSG